MRNVNEQRQKSARRRMLAASVRVLVALFVGSVGSVGLNSSVALAEGFPGIGDRLLYADALPHYNLGNKYLAKEWYEKAVEKYWDAIGIYEYDADVYVNLSVAYRKLGNVTEAENASKKAVKLKPDDWTTWSNLANLLMAQDRFPESFRCFNKALKCPGMPESEKTFIESNIDGMKKIMKARGLTIEGKELAPPAVAGAPASKKRNTKIASKNIGASASRTPSSTNASASKAPALRSNQVTGSKESELDTGAYDQWVGGK